jgi:hypothetical protein
MSMFPGADGVVKSMREESLGQAARVAIAAVGRALT